MEEAGSQDLHRNWRCEHLMQSCFYCEKMCSLKGCFKGCFGLWKVKVFFLVGRISPSWKIVLPWSMWIGITYIYHRFKANVSKYHVNTPGPWILWVLKKPSSRLTGPEKTALGWYGRFANRLSGRCQCRTLRLHWCNGAGQGDLGAFETLKLVRDLWGTWLNLKIQHGITMCI